ncbi:DUF58 domain-containing protein [Catenulispora rubra]|uniref:DUF58 domain-containing protein n=1 Tax=Catenulispora rubra TaxID=280293 RepID=UPI00189233DF|nr:DUF58 domain-containing protein [Catenulispora rubra]
MTILQRGARALRSAGSATDDAAGNARGFGPRISARVRARSLPSITAHAVARTVGRAPLLAAVTPLGWSVVVGAATAWILGTGLHWIEFSALAAFCMLVLLGSLLFGVGRTELAIEVRTEPRRLRIGQPGACTVGVVNIAKRRLLPVDLEIPVGGKPGPPFQVPRLKPGAAHGFEPFEIGARRRSVITVGPATSVRGDPLGLVRRTVTWTGATEILVHPRYIELPAFGVGRMHDLEGRTADALSPSDLAFHALRDYVPGDDPRHVHWRSSARARSLGTGTGLVVRQYQETRRTHLLVAVDGRTAAYRDGEDLETAISAAASLALCALDNELEASVVVCDRTAPDATDRAVLDACARALPTELTLGELVDRGVHEAPHATAVVVVTGGVPDSGELFRAAARVPESARTVLLRVDPGARTGAFGRAPAILTMNTLGDLALLFSEGDLW